MRVLTVVVGNVTDSSAEEFHSNCEPFVITEPTQMTTLQQPISESVLDAFEQYARAIAAHRQQNPKLTFAGFLSSYFERSSDPQT